MAEHGDLVHWQPARPLTPLELLTAQFYAWERRGRGWHVSPYPVELEPPFRPFVWYAPAAPGPPVDDARKPTLLSSLVDKIRGQSSRAMVPLEAPEGVFEPEAEIFTDDSALVEMQVSIPPTLKVTQDTAEQFLLSLAYGARPLAFELVGLPDAVTVQLVCREEDRAQFTAQLRAHFPDVTVAENPGFLRRFWNAPGTRDSVVIDFGLSHEFMRPLRTFTSFEPDPLVAVVGALSGLASGEIGVLQVLFQPARSAWTENIMRAVTDGEGGPFFVDAPEMVALAREKISRPLVAAVVRIAAQSSVSGQAWELARALGGALSQFSNPTSNELIPLSGDDYGARLQEDDLLARCTHRSGMLLNSEELVSLVHLPSASVRSEKLIRDARKSKAAPAIAVGHRLVLGENIHGGKRSTVTLSPEHRSRHTYVIGASGTGKSTLLLNLIIQDLEHGQGVGVLDPHGDLIDRILGYVPEERLNDVVLLDPADADYPIGFNILSAHSDLEKNLLASDLVAVFRRLSTSWGDQMTSVLGNAVLAMLESERGGTLADLRRFLVEPEFRREFLTSVRDPEVVYYWQKEFPLLAGKPQAPLLTRLDAFLRPKLIRYMVAQRENRLDFGAIMNGGKIFLAKLSQGAIGEENAYLLGSLLVSKFYQVALTRQERAEAERRPFYLYIDEFHNFVTPSMAQILSGARKYGLGLVLAHQDLHQLSTRDQELLGAVLTNPCTRVCFRVGDLDARKLTDGFAFFDTEDLQSLGIGEALCRIERADHDFNLRTLPLPAIDTERARARTERIVAHSRTAYGTSRESVQQALERARLPAPEPEEQRAQAPKTPVSARPQEQAPRWPAEVRSASPKARAAQDEAPTGTVPTPRVGAPESPTLGRGGGQHRYLQHLIKRWAESRGYRATIEQQILDGLGSVDVALEKGELRIACEISVGSSAEQEHGNVQKCLAAGFAHVAIISPGRKTLGKAREIITARLDEGLMPHVRFVTPEELFAFLEELDAHAAATDETVRGYKVKVRYQPVDEAEKATKKQAISTVILKALRRLKGDT